MSERSTKTKLSYTQINAFLQCRKRWWFSYHELLATKGKARALQVGDFVHRLLHLHIRKQLTPKIVDNLDEWVHQEYPDNDPRESLSIALEALRLFKGYVNTFQKDPLQLIPGETILEYDLGEFILQGRVDCWARSQDQRLWRIEHKTTAKFDSHYLNGLKSGLQGAIYDYLSEQLLKELLHGTCYNLIVKTKIPEYKRSFSLINRRSIERMLETVHGVWRDIKNGDYYPSSACFSYNRECEFRILCERDTPANRIAFFQKKEVKPQIELEAEVIETNTQ